MFALLLKNTEFGVYSLKGSPRSRPYQKNEFKTAVLAFLNLFKASISATYPVSGSNY